ncbi:hypothetical protein [Desnuesiella massiliensis]|uniref:hypothetical protein n=1 Tax=Desnuesiella massiliensis TaxID=1650662 RepID=UPI0006E24395|nr:hypothetical protein [Desnuesiella massiliensis]
MSKYRVGDELIIIERPGMDEKRLSDMTKLSLEGDFAEISWGLKILNVEYDKPNVTLTYKNAYGQINKVFAVCVDIDNFNQQKVLEKALLKAFQNEIINITVYKNNSKQMCNLNLK